MIAPDETTFRYSKRTALQPHRRRLGSGSGRWKSLASHPGARFYRELVLHAEDPRRLLSPGAPVLAWGDGDDGSAHPILAAFQRLPPAERLRRWERALGYMALEPARPS